MESQYNNLEKPLVEIKAILQAVLSATDQKTISAAKHKSNAILIPLFSDVKLQNAQKQQLNALSDKIQSMNHRYPENQQQAIDQVEKALQIVSQRKLNQPENLVSNISNTSLPGQVSAIQTSIEDQNNLNFNQQDKIFITDQTSKIQVQTALPQVGTYLQSPQQQWQQQQFIYSQPLQEQMKAEQYHSASAHAEYQQISQHQNNNNIMPSRLLGQATNGQECHTIFNSQQQQINNQQAQFQDGSNHSIYQTSPFENQKQQQHIKNFDSKDQQLHQPTAQIQYQNPLQQTHQQQYYQHQLPINEEIAVELEQIDDDKISVEENLDENEKIYNRSVRIKKLLKYIEQGDLVKEKIAIQGQDILLLIGKTGCGKSTTLHFLQGIPLKRVLFKGKKQRNGKEILCEKKVLKPDQPLQGFDIGFKQESKTRFINVIYNQQNNLTICDTPGFKDSRNIETDIANVISITQAIHSAASVRPLLLISYYELVEGRGGPIRETLRLITRLIKNIYEIKLKLIVAFTHVEDNVTRESIQTKLLELVDSQDIKADLEVHSFLDYLLNQFLDNFVPIIRPHAQSNENLWKNILIRQPIDRPLEVFEYTLSKDASASLNLMCNDVKEYTKSCVSVLNYEALSNCLHQFFSVSKRLNQEFLNKTYRDCLEQLFRKLHDNLEITLTTFDDAMIHQSTLSQKVLTDLMKTNETLENFEKFKEKDKEQIFKEASVSLQDFHGRILNRCNSDYLLDSAQNSDCSVDFNKKINTIVKIQQLKQIFPWLDKLFDESKQVVVKSIHNQQVQSEFQINQLFKEFIVNQYTEKDINSQIGDLVKTLDQLKNMQESACKLLGKLDYFEKSIFYTENRLKDYLDSINQKMGKINILLKDIDYASFEKCLQQQTPLKELMVLRLLESNSDLSTHIDAIKLSYKTICENIKSLCNKQFQDIKTRMNQSNKELKKVRNNFALIKMMRSLDQEISLITQEDYFKFINDVQDRIQIIDSDIKKFIKKVKQEENDQSCVRINYSTLSKKLKLFNAIKWIDQELQMELVANTYNKAVKRMEEYVPLLQQKCNDYFNEKNFTKLSQKIQELIDFKNINLNVTGLDQAYENVYAQIKNGIEQTFQSYQLVYGIKIDVNNPILDWKKHEQILNQLYQFQLLPPAIGFDVDQKVQEAQQYIKTYIQYAFSSILSKEEAEISENVDSFKTQIESLKNFLKYQNLVKIIDNFDEQYGEIFIHLQNSFDLLVQRYQSYIREKQLDKVEEIYIHLQTITQKLKRHFNSFQSSFSSLMSPKDCMNDLIRQANEYIDRGDLINLKNIIRPINYSSTEQAQRDKAKILHQFRLQYKDRVKKICQLLQCYQNIDQLQDQNDVFTESMNYLTRIKPDVKELVGQDFIKRMNTSIANALKSLIENRQNEIISQLNYRQYKEMEQSFIKYRQLKQFVLGLLPDVGFEDDETGSQISQSFIDSQGILAEISSSDESDFQERFDTFINEVREKIQSEEYQEEKNNIKAAKKTLDSLQQVQYMPDSFFITSYRQNYENLKKYYEDLIQAKVNEIKSIIQQGKIKSAQQMKREYEKKIQILEDHLELNDFQQSLDEQEREITSIRRNQHDVINQMINKKQFEQCNEYLLKLKLDDFEKYEQLAQMIYSLATERISVINTSLQNQQYQNIGNLLYDISGLIQLSEHFSQQESQGLKIQYEEIYKKTYTKMDTSINQMHNFWVKENVVVVEEGEVNFFLANLQLLRSFENLGFDVNAPLQTANQIQQHFLEIIQLYQTSLDQCLEDFDCSGIEQCLKRVQDIYTFIKHFKRLSQEGIQEQALKIELMQAINKSHSKESLKKIILNKIKQFTEECLQDWEQCNYMNVADLILKIKRVSLLGHLFTQEEQQQQLNIGGLMQQIATNIKLQAEEALAYIHRDDFTQELDKILEKVWSAHEALFVINGLYEEQYKQIIVQKTIEKLKSRFFEQNPRDLQSIARKLIEIQKMEQVVPTLAKVVFEVINEALGQFRSLHGASIIFQLSELLEKEGQDVGKDIVITHCDHFKLVNIDHWNQITSKHTLQYTIDNFKRKEKGEYAEINKDMLKIQYELYQMTYKSIIDYYIQQNLKGIDDIIKEIKLKLQYKPINLHEWTNSNKEYACIIIAHIFAYWSLMEMKGAIHLDTKKHIVMKKPNHTQVLSIMMLLNIDASDSFLKQIGNAVHITSSPFKNQLIQILTGEGKSVTLGIISVFLALCGLHVDVVCYSQYLSNRDYDSFQNLFIALGVEDYIFYGTFDEVIERMINNGGNIRDLTKSLINNTLLEKESYVQRKSILLIDEVDVFFGESFYGLTYNPIIEIVTKQTINIVKLIWQNKSLTQDQILVEVFKSNDYIEFIQQFSAWKALFDKKINQMIIDVKQYKNHSYIIDNGQIGYKQNDTVSFSTYYGYKTMFAYLQEFENGRVSEETLNQKLGFLIYCGNFSYAEIANQDGQNRQYANILGTTGTLDHISDQMRSILENYNIKRESYAPSMFGKTQLIFDPATDIFIIETLQDLESSSDPQEEWMMKIQFLTEKHIKQKQSPDQQQAVLIIFQDRQRLQAYYNSSHLVYEKSKYQVLLEETENKDHIVKMATRSGKVTLLLRDFGRGTDFICIDDKVSLNGGVVVIQTFLAEDKCEEMQIRGRTARQGQEGRYYLVLLDTDLQNDFDITSDEIREHKDSSEKHKFLNQKMKLKKDAQLNKQLRKITQATNVHHETMYYKQLLLDGDKDGAIRQLLKFNKIE